MDDAPHELAEHAEYYGWLAWRDGGTDRGRELAVRLRGCRLASCPAGAAEHAAAYQRRTYSGPC